MSITPAITFDFGGETVSLSCQYAPSEFIRPTQDIPYQERQKLASDTQAPLLSIEFGVFSWVGQRYSFKGGLLPKDRSDFMHQWKNNKNEVTINDGFQSFTVLILKYKDTPIRRAHKWENFVAYEGEAVITGGPL